MKNEAAEKTQEERAEKSPVKPIKPAKKLPREKIALIIGAIVLVSIIGAAAFFGFKKPTEESAEEISPTPTLTLSPTPTPELSPSPTSTPPPVSRSTPTPTITLTPSPTPKPLQEKIINSAPELDGFRSNNGGGNEVIEIRAGNGPMVGSPPYELVIRGFLSFSLGDIPGGGTVEKATLRIYQARLAGNPYAADNELIVDHLNYGTTLDDADYNRTALSSNIGTITKNAALEWKDLDVTDEVKNDWANDRSRSQFRIRFSSETDGNGSEDIAYFEAAENTEGTGNTPQLVIQYR